MIVDVVGDCSIVVEHTVRLVWRWEFRGPNIGFVHFDVLEEL